ncbi:FbpB family small basic protein [Caldifermentibacillus hisashii]|uniref:FbpB family small basic protein n=1 Tax=Caldifermentibacillus hisashii TaxID=996558 RepID=A0ABU9K3E3_9BACI
MRGKIKRIKELIRQNKAELIKNKVELEKIDEKVEQNLLKRHLIKE